MMRVPGIDGTDIVLPKRINADGLLPFLSLIGSGADVSPITLDFCQLERVTPAGLVGLIASVHRWRKVGYTVLFKGFERCRILGYLQRMDVLKHLDVPILERFERHENQMRFVPVTCVQDSVDRTCRDIVACLAPGGEDYEHPMSGLYDLAWYVLTEVLNNTGQHSYGGTGYAAAQVTHSEGLVRLAIADNGIGILQSFQYAGCPWSHSASAEHAIERALEPRMSSKTGDPNEGVGLTLVSKLAELTEAWLLIVSGEGVLRIDKGGTPKKGRLADGGTYGGTLIALSFREDSARDFAHLLHEAKIRAGLLHSGSGKAKFSQ